MKRVLLAFLIASALTAEPASTDLSFIDCSSKNHQSSPISRSVKSQILTSPSGWRAYASVTALAEGGSCRNTTKLYAASPEHDFAPVYKKSAEGTQDGNGLRLLGWSSDGKKLLAETANWAYGSDAPPNVAALVYDPESGVRTLDVAKSLDEHFGKYCLYLYSVAGWDSASSILLQVRPYRDFLDNRRSCVAKPTSFVYQIEGHILEPQ